MAIKIQHHLTPIRLVPAIERLFDVSAAKILDLEKDWAKANGSPVFTVRGKYTSRGWTEWTQGFQFGSALLQFDATGDEQFLEIGRRGTVKVMASHVSHVGVHDHGFNNISTYGNLWRLMYEGKLPSDPWQNAFYELALKASGAVQAARWTALPDGGGFIYSFNGPHSLFVDTIRSLRSLAVAHQLGHVLMGERDERISLLRRLIQHAVSTAQYNLYYGEGRDQYDVPGRTAHESIFNLNDGSYRCPSSQQGYSPFTTWTRGLSWALLGFAEELEFLNTLRDSEINEALQSSPLRGRSKPDHSGNVRDLFLRAARTTADFYLENCCTDGVPMWDTGAPNLTCLGEYLCRPSDPFNQYEPVDSSAAAIAAQGLIRLGNWLTASGNSRLGTGNARLGTAYVRAGLTIAATLLDEPYLSLKPNHQGLLLHSVYHRPKGWDYIHKTEKVPNCESSMWGDYHTRELALLILRQARGEHYLTFFQPHGVRT